MRLVEAHISQIVTSIRSKNVKVYKDELAELVKKFGPDAHRHLIKALFKYVNIVDNKSNKESLQQTQLLSQELTALCKTNYLSVTLCNILESPEHHTKGKFPSFFLPQLTRLAKFSPVEELQIGLSLIDSMREDLSACARSFVKPKLQELIQNPNANLPIAFLQQIVLMIRDGEVASFGVSKESCESYLQGLKKLIRESSDKQASTLAPLLEPISAATAIISTDVFQNAAGSTEVREAIQGAQSTVDLAEILQDCGYESCSSVHSVLDILAQVPKKATNAASIARVIGMMNRTISGLHDGMPLQASLTDGSWERQKPDGLVKDATSWEVHHFIDAVKTQASDLSWRNVMDELDFAGFEVNGLEGFRLIVRAYRRATKAPFPIDILHKNWKNSAGQLSFWRVLSDPKHALVNEVSQLIQLPTRRLSREGLKNTGNHDSSMLPLWSSLDYVKTMMHLGERGHYQEVYEALKPCMTQYPDILALDLAESFRGSWGPLQRNITSNILKKFLEPGPNASFVLSRVFQSKPEVVTQAILKWYIAEPSNARLVRILDIAQDTKALTELLQVPEPPFVLRLACLASHRGFLNLEKWFQVQVANHHELILPESVDLVEQILEKGHGSGQTAPGHKLAALAILQVLANEIAKVDESNKNRVMALISKHIKRPDAVDQPNEANNHNNNNDSNANNNATTGSTNNSTALTALGVSKQPLSVEEVLFATPSLTTTTPILTATTTTPTTTTTTTTTSDGDSGGDRDRDPMQQTLSPSSPSSTSTPHSLEDPLTQQQDLMRQEQQRLKDLLLGSGSGAVVPPLNGGQNLNDPSASVTNVSHLNNIPAALPGTLGDDSADMSLRDLGAKELSVKERKDISERTFSKIIDDEANSYFAQIYNSKMSITEVVDLLQKFKISTQQHDQDVFACMLRNLFDEYRFFPQYPEKELGITGVLFGCLVQHNLVTQDSLKKALRYVLEALKKEVDTKMFKFGVCALDKFKERVSGWPQYAQMVLAVPHFDSFPAELKAVLQPIAPLGGTDGVDGATPATAPTFGSSNVSSLLLSDTHMPQPPLAVQDKIQMVFNNLSPNNLEAKANELKLSVTAEFYPWLAQYLVVKRCSLEPNYHILYADFLFKLRQPVVIKGVLRETLDKILVLLRSQKIADSGNSSERKLLKNLGSWLGLQTVARNKPILHKDLAIKELILFAYEQGPANLLYIVPFVAKILETCKESIVFRPPNPWTMGILSVLKEMHQLPKLRLNLKFEVEVLCNHLELNIDTLQSSTILATIQPMTLPAPLSTDEAGSERASPPPPPAPIFPDLIPGVISSIGGYVAISTSITLFQQQVSLKPTVQHALERAIEEIINPVVDRSVKIACISCQKLITKDFALEPDEAKLREAAHRMVQHLAGNLAMVTAKDPVRQSIGNHLRTLLMGSLPPEQQKSAQISPMIDQAIGIVCNDNLELACAFIKTTAMERAIPEVDDALKENYGERRHHRSANPTQPFHDAKNYGLGVSTLPAPLRPKFGGLQPNQFTLYNNLVKYMPTAGSPKQPNKESPLVHPNASPKPISGAPPTTQQESHPPHEKLLMKLEQFTKLSPTMDLASLPSNPQVHGTMRELLSYINQSSSRSDLVVYLHQRLLLRLLEVDLIQNTLLRDVYLDILTQLQESYRTVASDITKSFKLMPGDHKFNSDIVARLLQARLLDPKQLDAYLAKAMEGGRNFLVAVFVEDLLQRCFLSERKTVVPTLDDFTLTLDVVAHVISRANPPRESQVQLMTAIAQLRKPSGQGGVDPLRTQQQQQQQQQHQHQQQHQQTPNQLQQLPPQSGNGQQQQHQQHQHQQHQQQHSSSSSSSEMAEREPYNDPPGLRDQVRYLFEEWLRVHEVEKAGVIFVTKLMHPQIAMLRTDDISTRFFRLCADQAISMSYTQAQSQSQSPQQLEGGGGGGDDQPIRYHGVDAFTKLIVVLLTHFGESTKVALLNKVLKTIISLLIRDHERLGPRFNQKPYFRLLCNLLFDVHASDETISFQVLTGFTHAFHVLRPSVVPAFSFAWLELISHRNFMPKLLLMKDTKGWQMLQRLLIDLFSYTLPYLEVGKMNDAIRLLYKGTLRMLLVLLHDFPEFLAGYHFALCDVIPTRCIQMRNLILSAFPRNMRLPDPFTPNLKIDLLPEIAQPPRFLTVYVAAMQNTTLRQDVDSFFLSGPKNSTLLVDLCKRFLLPSDHVSGKTYNVPLLNSFVLYVAIKAMEEAKAQQESDVAKGPAADIFLSVASNMDLEGRYLLLNAIANQLRYPNSHTHYFSCMLLHLFAEADKEITREQITRVLLERLIVNRPHPWGLLITFVELIQNRTYDFWRHNFVQCAPEIERLFDSVARSCHTASRVAGEQVASN